MEFYRYCDHQTYNGIEIDEEKYILLRKTPCGHWIIPAHMNNDADYYKEKHKRWVNKTAKKRFAYPTKEEAKTSFIARKKCQCLILKGQLKQAESALRQLGIEPPKEHLFLPAIFD